MLTDEERESKRWEAKVADLTAELELQRMGGVRMSRELRLIQTMHQPQTGPDGITYCPECDTLTVPCVTRQAADRGLGL